MAELQRDGATRLSGAATAALPLLVTLADGELPKRPGVRLRGQGWAGALDGETGIASVARAVLPGARAVRALLFDKSAETNWVLGWHQDRVIAVRGRHEIPGYGPWTVKRGIAHVQPPIGILEGMITVRIHIDRVDAENAPLLVALGSHRRGRIAEDDIEEIVAAHARRVCLAEAGDMWVYSTPILHASERATRPGRRRVVQVDYAANALPPGLDWIGVA